MRTTLILSVIGLALGLTGAAMADDNRGERLDRGDRSEHARSHDDRAEHRDRRASDNDDRAGDADKDSASRDGDDRDGRKQRRHQERHSDRRS